MGCCYSYTKRSKRLQHRSGATVTSSIEKPGQETPIIDAHVLDAAFSEFSFSVLKMATDNFSSKRFLSENGAINFVYKGKLMDTNNRTLWIAVKKFTKAAWPDPKQFAEESRRIGKLKNQRLAKLIGFCCEGEQRLLVAEFMPNDTLNNHLFHWEKQSIEWAMRLRIGLYIAEALQYCNDEGSPLYDDLNADRILFDENGDPRLSCFGLMKSRRDGKSTHLAYAPPEYLRNGSVTPQTVVFSLGTVLLDLLSGKHIPPSRALDMLHESQNADRLMDSHMEGRYPTEEATAVVQLASRCLQSDPKDRPQITTIVHTLASLQSKSEVPSHVMLGIPIPKHLQQYSPSPLAEACSRMDLTAIHEIFVKTDYREDNATSELSFQEWTQGMRDMLEARKRGDFAFRDKDFNTTIDCYSQFLDVGTMDSPTVLARRSLCYLMCDQIDAALRDAIQTQIICPEWSIAFYLQSIALSKLGTMDKDAKQMLNQATRLEIKNQTLLQPKTTSNGV